MHLLLTAATPAEIQPTIDWITKNVSGPSHNIAALVTGVGAVSTTYLLTNHLNNNNRPDITIQAGIAGGFIENKIGESVVIKQDYFADLGAWENGQFHDIFDLNLAEKNQPPFNEKFLKNPNQKLLALAGLEQVTAITVNEITTDTKRIAWYKQRVSPVVESMEGAAFHYTCLQKKIPFLQLRSISNYIGERDKRKWKFREAIGNLNEKLISLFNKLSEYDETYFRV